MALCGIGSSTSLEGIDKWCFGGNFSTRLMVYRRFNGKPPGRAQRRSFAIQCSSSRKIVSEESVQNEASVAVDEESDSGHVIRFNMDDFKILDRVSVGFSGRVCIKNLNFIASSMLVTVVFLLTFESTAWWLECTFQQPTHLYSTASDTIPIKCDDGFIFFV